MLFDDTIVAGHSAFDVLAHASAVAWSGSRSVALHHVQVHGLADVFLRALETDHEHWIVFDVRRLAPAIEADIKSLPRRDADGVVAYHLRCAHRNAADLVNAALQARATMWTVRAPSPKVLHTTAAPQMGQVGA